MKATRNDTLAYLVPRILFFTLLSLFIYTLFVFLFTFAGAVWYSIFAILFFSLSFAFGLFSQSDTKAGHTAASKPRRVIELVSPLSGKIVPLAEVKDETFAEGIMGEGVAIYPTDDRVYAPVSGLIIAFFETHHAITVLSDEGAEILIHVGKDTVELKGKYFTPLKKAGERVKRGEALLTFDRRAIEGAGYDITTPITVANSARYALALTEETAVVAGDRLITLTED